MAGSKPASRKNSRPTTPAPAPDSQSQENRRARRKRERYVSAIGDTLEPEDRVRIEEKDKEDVDAEQQKKSTWKGKEREREEENEVTDGKAKATNNGMDTFLEADFIAFAPDDHEAKESKAKGKEKEDWPPPREWDKGKSRAHEREREREREHAGRKRKVGEFDRDDGYANKKQRVAAASRKAPWVADVDWESCTNVAEMLHRDVEAFVKYISPTPVEDEVRSLIVRLVTRAVTQAFPDAQVCPFGSYETKLYLPLGDIDLVVHSQSMAYNDKETVLHALANTVKRAGITDRVKIIARAKVPIVKFVTMHGRFSVDISVNQGNGIAAGVMIKHFLEELPALRSLVLIIKSFLSQRSMNEVFTGGLGSYSIVCLAISFLQMHPKIRRGEIDPAKNLGVLVVEFFELYGWYFNYHEVGISLRDGGSYFNKAERGWLDYGQPRLLSIEDPGDPSNDISKGSYSIMKVRMTLAGAHGIMTAAAYLQAGIFSARRERRYVDLRGTDRPEELSILASVMGVTQETINQRRLVQEVYDRRVLHRMLGLQPQATPTPQATQPERNGNPHMTQKDSVESAWEEADMELDSGDEKEEYASADESRYDIDSRAQPPKKRRKVGKKQDLHTVYTTDEEEEDGERSHDDDGLMEEEREYDVHDEEEANAVGKRALRDKRRSYWISKGVEVASDASRG